MTFVLEQVRKTGKDMKIENNTNENDNSTDNSLFFLNNNHHYLEVKKNNNTSILEEQKIVYLLILLNHTDKDITELTHYHYHSWVTLVIQCPNIKQYPYLGKEGS